MSKHQSTVCVASGKRKGRWQSCVVQSPLAHLYKQCPAAKPKVCLTGMHLLVLQVIISNQLECPQPNHQELQWNRNLAFYQCDPRILAHNAITAVSWSPL